MGILWFYLKIDPNHEEPYRAYARTDAQRGVALHHRFRTREEALCWITAQMRDHPHSRFFDA